MFYNGLDLSTFVDDMSNQRFSGTDSYIVTDDLMMAVNAAVTLQRPLLVKGEPGTGKTMLAEEVAKAAGPPLLQWHIKSTAKAQQGLYEYDAVARLRDSQLGDNRVHDIANYIVKRGPVWEAFESDGSPVLLIDEIDKADIEFPNDLLRELDRMEFYVYETQQLVKAKHRPIIIITSNNEKELPDAFLRRCFFHYIQFPDRDTMERIVASTIPGSSSTCWPRRWTCFFEIRDVPGLKKKPVDLRTARLDQAAGGRGHPAEALRRRTPGAIIPAAARRDAQERAGRAPVRAPGVHVEEHWC
jgi:MoxR-like ATPase